MVAGLSFINGLYFDIIYVLIFVSKSPLETLISFHFYSAGHPEYGTYFPLHWSPFGPLFPKMLVPLWSPLGTFSEGDLTCEYCLCVPPCNVHLPHGKGSLLNRSLSQSFTEFWVMKFHCTELWVLFYRISIRNFGGSSYGRFGTSPYPHKGE